MWKKAIFTLAFAAAAPLLVQCAASGGASGSIDPGDAEASGSVSGSGSAGDGDSTRSTSTTKTR